MAKRPPPSQSWVTTSTCRVHPTRSGSRFIGRPSDSPSGGPSSGPSGGPSGRRSKPFSIRIGGSCAPSMTLEHCASMISPPPRGSRVSPRAWPRQMWRSAGLVWRTCSAAGPCVTSRATSTFNRAPAATLDHGDGRVMVNCTPPSSATTSTWAEPAASPSGKVSVAESPNSRVPAGPSAPASPGWRRSFRASAVASAVAPVCPSADSTSLDRAPHCSAMRRLWSSHTPASLLSFGSHGLAQVKCTSRSPPWSAAAAVAAVPAAVLLNAAARPVSADGGATCGGPADAEGPTPYSKLSSPLGPSVAWAWLRLKRQFQDTGSGTSTSPQAGLLKSRSEAAGWARRRSSPKTAREF
mmetsp:Transcript_14560/g.34354  ORF Transcript_14560/g.34354 Transcript_14560/m.34354 type:complete len:353 (-) Transcript_14560:149-1207(-)